MPPRETKEGKHDGEGTPEICGGFPVGDPGGPRVGVPSEPSWPPASWGPSTREVTARAVSPPRRVPGTRQVRNARVAGRGGLLLQSPPRFPSCDSFFAVSVLPSGLRAEVFIFSPSSVSVTCDSFLLPCRDMIHFATCLLLSL